MSARTTGPQKRGLAAALDDMAHDDRGLWAGAAPLFARELPFTLAKFVVYANAQTALLAFVPAARERPLVGLAVSLVSGIAAGTKAKSSDTNVLKSPRTSRRSGVTSSQMRP